MNLTKFFGACTLLVCSGTAAFAQEPASEEALPAGAAVTGLEVAPPDVRIEHRFGYVQLLVTAALEGGDRVDVTRFAKIEKPGDFIEVSAGGLVRPKSDGSGEIRISLGERSLKVPVKVEGFAADYRASFVRDVMPVLSKVGCTAGTCHGSAKGQNGFKLSLRGYDAQFDHQALTDDMEGRRINRAAPDRSLFLMKVSGAVPHVGGVLTKPGEPYYDLLRLWVAQGVKLDLDIPRISKIEIFPKSAVLPLPGMRQQMAVLATYADGLTRDITAEAIVETSNTEVTKVDKSGLVTALRRGEAAILARYEGRYAAVPMIVMGDRSGFAWKDVPEYNTIDGFVYKKLRRVKTTAADVCTDAEFVRRVYLDLIGLAPRSKEVRAFLMDSRDSRKKREELVDRLIGSAEFVEYWTNKWADLLQVNAKFLGSEGAAALRAWISQAVASNMPYDQFAHSILNAQGSTLANPPAAYFKVLRKPQDLMENTTQLFLGVRFNCNQCHDHPFERWTQNNYWQLSAFFAQVGRKDAPGSPKMPQLEIVEGAPAPPAYEEIIFDEAQGDVKNPKGVVVQASFPFKHEGKLPEKGTRRETLAAWVATADNPYFAKSYVNRLWSYLLGVGIIDPIDDIRAGNPPSNPELLDWLTQEFIKSSFDARHILRLIVTSRAYQHSIQTDKWNEDDTINFSHAIARRLPAETLFDALYQATGTQTHIPGVRMGTRAAELPDPSIKPPDGFLDIFGRPPRESACECERTSGMSLGQALNLVNGPTVADAIKDPSNRLTNLLSVEKSPRKVAEEIFLSFLCRMPNESELNESLKALNSADPQNVASLEEVDRKDLVTRLAAWEQSQVVAQWTTIEPGLLRSAGGATLAAQKEGAVLASGANPEKDTYSIVAWTPLEKITGVRLEVLPDDSLPAKGPGRAANGNLVVSELKVVAAPIADPAQAKAVVLQNASADFAQEGMPVKEAIDGKPEKGWAISPQIGRAHQAVFETKEDVGAAGGTLLTFTVDQLFGQMHTIGRLRLSVTSSPRPVRVLTIPEAIAEIVRTAADKRTPDQQAQLLGYYLAKDEVMGQKIRLANAQDIAWALANSPAFLFNR